MGVLYMLMFTGKQKYRRVKQLISEDSDGMIVFIEARSSLVEQIRAHHFDDEKLCIIRDKVLRWEAKEVVLDPNGVLRIGGRICVPKTGDLIRLILEEAHCSRFSIHPRAAKMYHDLSQHYWLCGMTRDISNFVSRCLTCQQTVGQSERMIQVLEDILQACVIDFRDRWDRHRR
nr:uncharacterized protein LOC109119599 [Solanum lycopersicum]